MTVTEATSGPGKLLRAERETLGVTVREVADTLNLSIAIVQALEADDYERLPGTVFARGYIRSYARLLDLDPVPLLELFPRQTKGNEVNSEFHEAGIAEWVRGRPALVLSVLAVIVVALLAGLFSLIWPEEGIDSLWRTSDSSAVTVPPSDTGSEWGWEAEADDAAGASASEAATSVGLATDANGQAAQPAADRPAGEPVDLPPGVGPAVVEGTAGGAGDEAARRLTETGDQRLRMDFSADSWVEIRNSGGRVLYSNLNKAGTVLELVGEGPFRILLGYAPGVTLAFEGEQVALAPHTRNNVATLVLGQ